ncbi:MAG TPA: PAS domain S-box protein [Campylobacterales bacterium]|nr:PAS domain S-box protein [Campylobacterales bacterium]HIP41441.1 PAS domain S-box protein [Campylobacterales bacterium]
MIYRPLAIDQEIKFNKKKFIVSKTDTKGKILFVNKNLCDISGYEEEALVGSPHNVLRHPDMPQSIFFLVWNSLLRGEHVSAVLKNLARSGEYYWVIVDFDVKKDQEGNIKSFSSFQSSAPKQVIETMEELYETMLKIEKKHGMEGSLSYLESFLEERGVNYDNFLDEIIKPKGFMNKFFGGMWG